MRRARLIALIFASTLVMIASLAGAQTPLKPAVALVLEVSGGRIAGIEPYRKISADTTVTVPAGVRLVFQHYASCRRYVLVGGVVTTRADGVDFSGGARPTDTRVPCSRKVALKSDGTSAAVVMRSVGPPAITISPRPDFVLVGPPRRRGHGAARATRQ